MASLKIRLFPLVLIILCGLMVVPAFVERAHASRSGLICLADVTTAPLPPQSPCLSGSGPIFDGPVTSPFQQIRMGVFVNNSAGFLAFDVTLNTNSTVLRPAGIDLSGSILSQPLIALECLGGLNLTQASCDATVDSVDTLRLAAASFAKTSTPSTGLLFTAIYNITGTTSRALPIGFQTGCSGTSVSGVCVTFADGSSNPVPETIQAGSFDNNIPIPFLGVSSNASIAGPMIVGTTATIRLNLTSWDNWNSQSCSCTAILSTISDPSIKIKFNTTSISVPTSDRTFVALNVSGSSAGNYSLTVLVQYSSLDLQNFGPDTLVAHVSMQVVVTDFDISASPVAVAPVLAGVTALSIITVMSENGFSGTVTLSTNALTGQCQLSPEIFLLANPTVESTLECSWSLAGNYTVTVTGVSGQVSHSVQVYFFIQDFAVALTPSNVNFVAGTSKGLVLTVSGLNGFDRQVSVSASAPSALKVELAQSVLSSPGGVSLVVSGGSAGVYTVNVTVTSEKLSHTEEFQVVVTAAPGGSSSLFGFGPSVFYSIIALLGIVVVAVAVLGLRARRRNRTDSDFRRGNKVAGKRR